MASRLLGSLRRSPVQSGSACLALTGFWTVFYHRIWDGTRTITWDLAGFNFPLDKFAFAHLSWGSIPQFDPYSYNGIDFIGNSQAALFYPPKLLLEVALKVLGQPLTFTEYETLLLAHVLIFSIGAFLMTRLFTRSWLIGLFVAISITYSGFFQGQLEHLWFFSIVAWTPLAFYGLHRGMRGWRPWGFVIYALAALMMILVGYPLLSFTVWVLIIVAALVVERLSGRAVGRRALAHVAVLSLIAILLASAALLPFLKLSQDSVAAFGGAPFQPGALLTLVEPNRFGALSGQFDLAGADRTNSYFFLGTGVLALPAVVWAWIRGGSALVRRTIMTLVAAVTVLMLLMFVPLTGRVPFGADVDPWMFGSPWVVAVIALLALGLDTCWKTGRPTAVLALLLVALSIITILVFNRPAQFNTVQGSPAAVAADTVFLGDPATTRMILADSPEYSVFDDLFSGDVNEFRMIGVRSLGGQDPLVQSQYLQLLDAEGDAGVNPPNRTPVLGVAPNFSWLASNGVKYVLAPSGAYPANPRERDLIFSGDGLDVWRLHNAKPLISIDNRCGSVSGVQLTTNQLSFTIVAPHPDCVVRATINFSTYWQVTGATAELRPIPGGLGFDLVDLPGGSHKVVLRYSNPWYSAGTLLSLVGFLLLLGYVVRFRSRLGRPASTGVTPTHVTPAP